MISELLIIIGVIIGIYLGEDISKVDTTCGAFIVLGLIGGIVRFCADIYKEK